MKSIVKHLRLSSSSTKYDTCETFISFSFSSFESSAVRYEKYEIQDVRNELATAFMKVMINQSCIELKWR